MMAVSSFLFGVISGYFVFRAMVCPISEQGITAVSAHALSAKSQKTGAGDYSSALGFFSSLGGAGGPCTNSTDGPVDEGW